MLNLRMVGHFAGDLLVAGDVIHLGEFGFDGSEFAGEGVVGKDVGVLERMQAVVREDIEVAVGDSRFDGLLTHVSDETMLAGIQTEQVVEAVVGNDAGEMVNLVVRGDRLPAPCEIDGMGNEDGFVISKRILILQIPLFAVSIGWIFTVLAGSRCALNDRLLTIRGNAQTDDAIMGDIEPIAVVGLMRHNAQLSAFVRDRLRAHNSQEFEVRIGRTE